MLSSVEAKISLREGAESFTAAASELEVLQAGGEHAGGVHRVDPRVCGQGGAIGGVVGSE